MFIAVVFLDAQDAVTPSSQLIVTWFETGPSTAIALETPSGKVFLIDAGGTLKATGAIPEYNAGRDTISPYLKKRGHSKIDGLVISHPHADHCGGATWLLENWQVRQLVDHGYPPEATNMPTYYPALREQVVKGGGAYRVVHADDVLDWDPALHVEVLYPQADVFEGENDGSHSFLNNTSIILRVQHGQNVFIFPGDAYNAPPAVSKEKLKGTVLTAPHHGFHPHTSNFTKLVAPRYAVVTCWADYASNAGTPYPRSPGLFSIEQYGALGIETFVTAFDGNVTARSDGQGITMTTQRTRVIPPVPDLPPAPPQEK
jgi:competence protein ComEC